VFDLGTKLCCPFRDLHAHVEEEAPSYIRFESRLSPVLSIKKRYVSLAVSQGHGNSLILWYGFMIVLKKFAPIESLSSKPRYEWLVLDHDNWRLTNSRKHTICFTIACIIFPKTNQMLRCHRFLDYVVRRYRHFHNFISKQFIGHTLRTCPPQKCHEPLRTIPGSALGITRCQGRLSCVRKGGCSWPHSIHAYFSPMPRRLVTHLVSERHSNFSGSCQWLTCSNLLSTWTPCP
jgi:hypothetical protein